jgi:hypothetical protein
MGRLVCGIEERQEMTPEGGDRRETRVDTSELMMLNWRGRQSQSCALLPLLQMESFFELFFSSIHLFGPSSFNYRMMESFFDLDLYI